MERGSNDPVPGPGWNGRTAAEYHLVLNLD